MWRESVGSVCEEHNGEHSGEMYFMRNRIGGEEIFPVYSFPQPIRPPDVQEVDTPTRCLSHHSPPQLML